MATIETICKFNQFGFCKFLSHCRRHHVNEICLEMCNNCNCPKRHPKTCKFFEKYNRCKFGEYCAFAHKENPLVKEINTLKINEQILKEDLNDTGNEVLDLKKKVEQLENLVEELVNRVENITTPTKKGTKKRRRVKQSVTPSPSKKDDKEDLEHEPTSEEAQGQGGHAQTNEDSDQSENEITVEEIMKIYESG